MCLRVLFVFVFACVFSLLCVGLLYLTEQLSQDFYKTQSELEKSYGAASEIRLYALLVCLRLLRVNISHLVAWNVAPTECGFRAESATTDVKTAARGLFVCLCVIVFV